MTDTPTPDLTAPERIYTNKIRCAECDCANGGAECTWIKTPDPWQEGWRAGVEAARYVAIVVKVDCFAPLTRTREEAFSAACQEILGRLDALAEKGPD